MSALDNLIRIDFIIDKMSAEKNLDGFTGKFASSMDGMLSASKTAGGNLEVLGTKLQNVGGMMSNVGGTLTKFVTGPLVALGAVSLKSAIEFESAFAGVEKTVDATTEELAKMAQEIKMLSTVIPATTTEIAEVAEIAGQLGIAVPEVMGFTEVMINMGVSTNLSAEAAATALARLANIMEEKGVESYQRMGATIVELGNNYATTENEIVNLTMRLASAGKQVGMSTADIMGMAAGMSTLGLTAEAGGTAMSKFMSSMQMASSLGTGSLKKLEKQTGMTWRQLELMSSNSGKDFKELADSIGMTTAEMNIQIKAGKDLDNMSKVAGLSADEFAKKFREGPADALALFFDGLYQSTNGMRDLNELGGTSIEILSAMGINEVRLRDALQRTGGAQGLFADALKDANRAWDENKALTEEAEKRYATLESQITMMKNAWKLVAINLGTQLMPVMKKLTEFLKDIAIKINEMPQEKFNKLVKGLVAIASIGPGLKLAGGALSLFGTGLKLLNGSSAILNSMIELPKNFADGGWTKGAIRGFNALKPEYEIAEKGGVLVAKGFGKINKSMEDFMPRAGVTQKELAKITATDVTFFGKLGGLWDALKVKGSSMMSSPAFKAAGWVAVAAYATTLFKPLVNLWNEFDRLFDISGKVGAVFDLLGKIISPLVNIFKSVVGSVDDFTRSITGGAMGVGDLVAILGGLMLGGPMGLAVAGIAALKGAIGLLTDFMSGASSESERMAYSIGLSSNAMANMDNEYTKFLDEKGPRMIELYENMAESVTNLKFVPDPAESAKSIAEFSKSSKELQSLVSEQNRILEAEITRSFKERGELGTDFAKETLLKLKINNAETEKSISESIEAIKVIEALARTQKRELTANEVAEIEEHQKNIEEASLKAINERFEKELGAMRANIARKKSLGIKLTDEEQTALTKTLVEKQDNRLKKIDEHYGLLFTALEKSHGETYTETEEYQKLMNKMHNEYNEAYEISAKEYLKTTTRLTDDQINDYIRLNRELATYNQERLENQETTDKLEKARRAQEIVNKEKATMEEIRLLGLQEDEYKGLSQYLNDTLPPELTRGMKKVEKSISFSKVQENTEKMVQKFESSGANASGALGKGFDSKAPETWNSINKFLRKVADLPNKVFQINSPSRIYRDAGAGTMEGLALGIDENAADAENSMMKALRSVADLAESPELDLSTGTSLDINKHMTVDSSNNFVSAISDAVVDGFKRQGPLKAYLDKEEAQELTDQALVEATSGGYNS